MQLIAFSKLKTIALQIRLQDDKQVFCVVPDDWSLRI